MDLRPARTELSLVPGRDGLVHISKLGDGKRIDKLLASRMPEVAGA